MPSEDLLNTLVKLAAAGTSGICVLAIAACGWIMLRLPPETPIEKHKSLRFYMAMCFAIAILSAATTFGAGYWDYKKVAALKSENAKLGLSLTNTVQKNMELSSNLNMVTRQKVELADVANRATSEAETATKRARNFEDRFSKLDQEFSAVQSELGAYKATGFNPDNLRSVVNENKQLKDNLSALKDENVILKKKLNIDPVAPISPLHLAIPPK